MNFNAKTSRTPLALASTALMASLLLSGCGQEADPGTKESASTHSAHPSEESSENTVDQTALLDTNEKLSKELGEDYVQGWIKDGKLHVSTTNESKTSIIEDAGAIGHVVKFSNKELRAAIGKIMSWQSKQETPISSSIHAYSLNPETGGLTLSVDSNQIDALQTLIKTEKPIGEIPVDLEPSGGIGSPASN